MKVNAHRFGMNRFPPPTKCPDCGAKLTELMHVGMTISLPCKCGCSLEWSHPHVWRRRHNAGPLFDDRKVIYDEGAAGFVKVGE